MNDCVLAEHASTLSDKIPRLLPDLWWRYPIAELARLAPIEPLFHPEFDTADIEVAIKREDLLCPFLGGNKLYKLHFHLQRALALRANRIVSFGGAYSNHLYALARVGAELGIQTLGVVRGEEALELSPTLQDAKAMGMQLMFVSRSEYREKNSANWRERKQLTRAGNYIVPEGGGDIRGALGMANFWQAVNAQSGSHFNSVICAAGTGATLAGLMAASLPGQTVHGVAVLRGSANMYQRYCKHALAMAHALRRGFSTALREPMSWQLHTDFHAGGYGPARGEFAGEIQRLACQVGVPLDPVYTGKMLRALVMLSKQRFFTQGSKVLVLHTGGLQGARTPAAQSDELF